MSNYERDQTTKGNLSKNKDDMKKRQTEISDRKHTIAKTNK